jgi:hypothetical protein
MGTLKKYIFGRVKGGVLDADAQAFITAASITNTTQQNAINNLVIKLKNDSIWSKFKAIYPMIGGNLFSHKFNLKDPRDLDAAHRLIFNGGWIHSANGALPNGTNGYADTNCNPNLAGLLRNSIHISYYSRTNNISSSDRVLMGTSGGGTPSNTALDISSTNGTLAYNEANGYSFNGDNSSVSIGLLMVNRIVSNIFNVYQNTNVKNLSSASTGVNNSTILIGSNRGTNPQVPQQFSSFQCAFSTIGFGLTDTEQNNFYNAIQTFQTSLGRQV